MGIDFKELRAFAAEGSSIRIHNGIINALEKLAWRMDVIPDFDLRITALEQQLVAQPAGITDRKAEPEPAAAPTTIERACRVIGTHATYIHNHCERYLTDADMLAWLGERKGWTLRAGPGRFEVWREVPGVIHYFVGLREALAYLVCEIGENP